jgi:hypothetical protein
LIINNNTTKNNPSSAVIPTKAGIHLSRHLQPSSPVIPASVRGTGYPHKAGMTLFFFTNSAHLFYHFLFINLAPSFVIPTKAPKKSLLRT